MSLAIRLLLAFGLLSLGVTAVVGVSVRESWRTAEEERFDERLRRATAGVEGELRYEARRLGGLLAPVCEHDAFVDQTLLALERRDLDAGRRLAVTQLVPEEMKALALDELTLVVGTGEVLGAGHDAAAAGRVDRVLASEIARPGRVTVRAEAPGARAALVTRCAKTGGTTTLGLVGARHLAPLLDQVGQAYDVSLRPAGDADAHAPVGVARRTTVPIAELGGLRVTASLSTAPLEIQLARLDRLVAVVSLAALGVASLVALALARSLSRPIAALASQAREIAGGEPRPVVVRGGGRELRDLAYAFNRAIDDLVVLRKRLAISERIAAQREIARRVAHEIKNPLAPIRAAMETLRRLRERRDPAFDDYFDEASRTVLDEVHRIARIVSEFTELARMPPPRPTPVDLAEVARGVATLHAEGTDLVRVDAAPVPPVLADRDQLVQVLTNLVQNGIDASAGGSAAQVRVTIARDGADHVRLVVEDEGPGVAEEMVPRLFSPYATTKPQGTGLGLAIVQRLVHEHGGDIAYERRSPHGARFAIRLPIAGPGRPPRETAS